MKATDRQGKILNSLVKDYIDLAEPISSEFLEKKHDFGICPATIRIEMQKLTEKGFLFQPHTSAGRVPTDKGYRFFVDDLFKKEFLDFSKDFEIKDWFEKEINDTVKFIQFLTKNLALSSHALATSYLKDENIFWKDGWTEILKEPEFREEDYITNFIDFLEDFEKGIEDFGINSGIKIYIGKENPFKKAKNFSIISAKCYLPDDAETILTLLGPKRMAYDRNIGLMNSLVKLLENF